MNLYFLALTPHQELREEVKALKEEMKENFQAGHALKSPAHITLQMPFKRREEDEPLMIRVLDDFASQQHPFTITLSDFGCFAPRVIFVKIENPDPMVDLHAQLNRVLIQELCFEKEEISPEIHPHMTIATRDLSKNNFKKAWLEFQNRKFKGSFTVKSLFLLKHNGKHWEFYREFLFEPQ